MTQLAVGFLAQGVPLAHGEFAREQDVILLPDGVTTLKNGSRVVLDRKGAEDAIAAFKHHGADLPFDINHSTVEKMLKGEEAPAFGWGNRLWYEPGRGLICHVKWTDEGYEAIAKRRYRYLSPVVGYEPGTKRVREIHSAALTTKPAVPRMPALAATDLSLLFQTESKTMSEQPEATETTADEKVAVLKALLKRKGAKLADDADVLAILDAAIELIQGGKPQGNGENDSATSTASATETHAATLEATLTQSQELGVMKAAETKRLVNERLQPYIDTAVLIEKWPVQMEAARYLAEHDPGRFEALMHMATPVVPQGRTVPPSEASGRRGSVIWEARRVFEGDVLTQKLTSEQAFVDQALFDANLDKLTADEITSYSIAKAD